MRIRRRLLLATLTFGLFVAAPATAGAKTVWLCKPGLASNPCTPGLDTARFAPDRAALGTDLVKRVRHPKIDCFYVYPTVSDQPTPSGDPADRPRAALDRALPGRALFARLPRLRARSTARSRWRGCRHASTTHVSGRAYRDVRAAWRSYLERYNRGRGVVLIGHSQGTFVLRRLIAEEIDRRPQVRRRLVSALLLGGNVTRAQGAGLRRRLRARSRLPLGSPARLRRGVLDLQRAGARRCPVRAHDRAGARGAVHEPSGAGRRRGARRRDLPERAVRPRDVDRVRDRRDRLPAAAMPPTTWLSFPGGYSARCSPAGGADVLRIAPLGGAPVLNPTPDATWGTAPGRREHRAREPGAARPPPGGGVRPRAPLTGFIPRSSGAWEACGTCAC